MSRPHPFVARRPDTHQLPLGMGRNRNEAAYREWAMNHPEIVALFLSFAKERIAIGRRFGIKAIVERVRWELPIRFPERQDEFRLNNSWVAYLSRDLLMLEPRLKQYIETRRVKGEA